METHWFLFLVQILAKLELANPTGSHKDRVAHKVVKGMLCIYEQEMDVFNKRYEIDLGKVGTLIIPTSGNLGIAVAAAAAKTHRVIVVVPEKTSSDRIQMLKALGAEIMRSPTEARPDAPESAFSVAAKLKEQLPNSHVIEEVSEEDMHLEKLLIGDIA